MNQPETPSRPRAVAHTSDHLANERTYLAWVRTAIALLGLGFVLARMGLFLRQLAALGTVHVRLGARAGTEFLWTGVLFLGLGTLLAAGAGLHFSRVTLAIQDERFTPSWGIVRALTLTVAGGGLLVVLLVLWQTIPFAKP